MIATSPDERGKWFCAREILAYEYDRICFPAKTYTLSTRLGVSRSEEAHDRWRDTEHSRDDTEFVVVEFDEPRALGRGEDGGLVEYGGRRSRRRRGARPRRRRRRRPPRAMRSG